jgi:tRNA(Ile)-lysidine synthase
LIERFQEALKQKDRKQILVPLTNGDFIWLHRGEVGLTIHFPTETGSETWNWHQQDTIEYDGRIFKITFSKKFDHKLISPSITVFDAALLPEKLVLTKRKDGDKMIPFGTDKSAKIKKLLNERKLTAAEKESLIILRLEDDTIIWLPTVRHSNFANISDDTTSVAYVEMIDKQDI